MTKEERIERMLTLIEQIKTDHPVIINEKAKYRFFLETGLRDWQLNSIEVWYWQLTRQPGLYEGKLEPIEQPKGSVIP